MYDDPLYDFYGWLLLLSLFVPIFAGGLVMLAGMVAGFVALFSSGGQSASPRDRVSVKLQEYDMDEDY
jgi:hypothetical protein